MRGCHAIEAGDLDSLFDALAARGYTIVGPTVRGQAIVYDQIACTADLPAGWTDEQDAGRYRLRRRDDQALFGSAVGAHSWKRYQLPPERVLWRGRVDDHGGVTDLTEPTADEPHYAFIGARSCELHASRILERVIGREDAAPFVVAVQCGAAGGTCFCVSMGSGPVAEFGFDLALTEVLAGPRHYFTVEVGSERGREALEDVPHSDAGAGERAQAARSTAHCTTTTATRSTVAGSSPTEGSRSSRPSSASTSLRSTSSTRPPCTPACVSAART